MYWFCHTSIWICHGCTRVPHPEPPSLLPPHTIPLGRPSAPTPSIQYHASNLTWWFVSYMILYMFQCHSPKSSHPLPLPQSPKDCSIHVSALLTLSSFFIFFPYLPSFLFFLSSFLPSQYAFFFIVWITLIVWLELGVSVFILTAVILI